MKDPTVVTVSELPVLDPIDPRILVSLLEKQTTVPASCAPACAQAAQQPPRPGATARCHQGSAVVGAVQSLLRLSDRAVEIRRGSAAGAAHSGPSRIKDVSTRQEEQHSVSEDLAVGLAQLYDESGPNTEVGLLFAGRNWLAGPLIGALRL